MVPSHDAEYWRKQADEARAAAGTMSVRAKSELLSIATAYERLAEQAERTAGRKGKSERSS